jgi:LysR family transcriptional regulator, regulator for bpeEF and oprC
MELNQLNAFVKVVETGSFTRAAAQMGTQKAYLSRVVSQLEQQLGVRLLERSTRALSVTEVGRDLYERAVAILSAVEDTERMAQAVHGEPRGTLKLSCGSEFGMIAVSAWIGSYLARYPKMTVEADFSNRLIDLVHEGFDLAIRVGPLPDSRLAARPLGELQYGLFAAPTYLSRAGTPHHPAELEGHPLIVFSGGRQQQGWELSCEQKQVHVPHHHVRLRVNNSFCARDAAIEGLGIVKLPLVLGTSAEIANQLQRLLPDWRLRSAPVHAVFASARYLTPKVRSFIDHALMASANTGVAESAIGRQFGP